MRKGGNFTLEPRAYSVDEVHRDSILIEQRRESESVEGKVALACHIVPAVQLLEIARGNVRKCEGPDRPYVEVDDLSPGVHRDDLFTPVLADGALANDDHLPWS